MQKKALVIIDIQNDITKNYKDVIGNINKARKHIDTALKYENKSVMLLESANIYLAMKKTDEAKKAINALLSMPETGEDTVTQYDLKNDKMQAKELLKKL